MADFFSGPMSSTVIHRVPPHAAASAKDEGSNKVTARNWRAVATDAVCIVVVFLGSTAVLWLAAWQLLAGSRVEATVPHSLSDLAASQNSLNELKEERFWSVLVLFVMFLIYKQTFSIPGSAIVNALGGALFGLYAWPLVCVLTAIGASNCYWMSYFCASSLAKRLAGSYMLRLQQSIRRAERDGDLAWLLLGSRLFPGSPNWLLNISSPHAGVPFWHFFGAVLVGLMPYNFVCVQAGTLLSSMNTASVGGVLTPTILVRLVLLAVAAMLPVVIRRWRAKSDKSSVVKSVPPSGGTSAI